MSMKMFLFSFMLYLETFEVTSEAVSSFIVKHSPDTSSCPQCGRNFVTERLVSIHHLN